MRNFLQWIGFLLLIVVSNCSSTPELPKAAEILLYTFSHSGSDEPVHSPLRNRALSTVSQSNGYLYYNFFASEDCTGDITYSSGIASETCLPSEDFNPPDHYYYSFLDFDFKSFQVKNLAENCVNTFVAFYNDTNCQLLRHSTTVSSVHFSTCSQYVNQTISSLDSFVGKCAVTTTIPAPSNSYVHSVYNQTNCMGPAFQYQAYVNDLCYGVYSTNSSSSFQCQYSESNDTVVYGNYAQSTSCLLKDRQSVMNISSGCTNAVLITEPIPVAAVSTLVDCIPASSADSNSSTKLSEGEAIGIVVAIAGFLLLVVAATLYFVAGKVCLRPSGGEAAVERESELSTTSTGTASLTPSLAGRYVSTIEETTNPLSKVNVGSASLK